MSIAVVEAPSSTLSFYEDSPAKQLTFGFEEAFEESKECYQTPKKVEAPAPRLREEVASPSPQAISSQNTRQAEPVKIGAVMLQLLRSYGITEEEIQEGLESYARKNRLSLAS